MAIEIISVGKQHDAALKDAIGRYERRLQKPFVCHWTLLPPSPRQATAACKEESERILSRIRPDTFVVLLDERGENITSPALAAKLNSAMQQRKDVVCVIGGAYGVSQAVVARANFVWSLSRLVFPHQIVRLLLVEQLYRAQCISRGHSYHHE
ncbi:MAG TPA: 23S rRNA (pseudouridine(1915)-N(3))-methyltransferase RlmH [Candidatus Saccharimonadales bacterium]